MNDIHTPQEWERISEIFESIIDLTPSERERRLAEIPDEDVRRAMAKLLQADDDDPDYLQSSPLGVLQKDADDAAAPLPEKIGQYQILSEIGRGGMGAVFLATRVDLPKQVALKVIKRGMDTDEILRRFQKEGQILSRLEHPNIARLLDAGTTADNAPFLVMEYIAGDELMVYCDKQKSSLAARLTIFRKICAAVTYAHQNLVIHRDLKPSNILMTADGEPKLLDFGISKLLSPDDADAAETGTATALGMMTPAYASPEQFRGETVSTATDVYSLGVILFELLTGELPYDIKKSRFEEAARIVSEIEPRRPSAVVVTRSTNQARRDTAAPQLINTESRATNPKLLRGDLDNIVLKALRKEPPRRYISVEQFSEDVRRHSAGLTVIARPDTFSYRASKFVFRNRLAVLSGLLIALSLISGIAATSWQAIRAEREKTLSEARFADVRQLANNVVFKYYDEIKDLTGATKAREMMVADAVDSLDRLAQNAGDNAALKLELAGAYIRIGNIRGGAMQANTGDTAGAVVSYEKAAALLDGLPENSADAAKIVEQKREAHKRLGLVLRRAGDNKRARVELDAAVALSEKLAQINPNDVNQQILLAQSYVNLCRVLPKSLKAGESVETCQKALIILDKLDAANQNDKAVLAEANTTENILGVQYAIMADGIDKTAELEKSREMYRAAAAHFQKAGSTAVRLIALEPNNGIYRRSLFAAKTNEGTARLNSGEPEIALEIQRAMLAEAESIAASDPANTQARQDLASVHSQLGLTQVERRDFAGASEQFQAALNVLDKLIAADAENAELQHDKFDNLINLGGAFQEQNNFAEAIKTYRAAHLFSQTAPSLKATPFVFYAEGRMHEKIGDCLTAEAKNNKISEANRNAKTAAARTEYQKAFELWQQPENAPEKFGLSSEVTEAVRRKAVL